MERRKFITNTLAGAGAFLLPCNIFPLPAENDFEMIKPVGDPLTDADRGKTDYDIWPREVADSWRLNDIAAFKEVKEVDDPLTKLRKIS